MKTVKEIFEDMKQTYEMGYNYAFQIEKGLHGPGIVFYKEREFEDTYCHGFLVTCGFDGMLPIGGKECEKRIMEAWKLFKGHILVSEPRLLYLHNSLWECENYPAVPEEIQSDLLY